MSARHSIITVSFLALALTLCWLIYRAPLVMIPRQVDLIQYWSGSILYFSGGNPYSEAEMAALQSPQLPLDETIRLWNPPIIFPLILPFALFEFDVLRVASFVWNITLILVVVLFLLFQYKVHLFHDRSRKVLYLMILTFVPFFEMLSLGQISSYLLMGVVGWWLFFQQQGLRSFTAGCFLSLSLIKPHLLVLVYFALFLYSYHERQFRLIFGLAIGAVVLASVSWVLRPDIWGLYFSAMSAPPIYWRNPNLGTLLQAVSGMHSVWIRHLPLLLSLLCFFVFFLRYGCKSREFDSSLLLILIPISLLVAPYGWMFDQVILLPWIFEVVRQTNQQKKYSVALVLCALAQPLSILVLPASLGQERGLLPLVFYSSLSLKHLYQRFVMLKKYPVDGFNNGSEQRKALF